MAAREKQGPSMEDHQSKPISILVADDHKLLSETVQMFLHNDGGFAVERADTLDAALQAIADKGHFDVVMLDLDMPGIEQRDRQVRRGAAKQVG